MSYSSMLDSTMSHHLQTLEFPQRSCLKRVGDTASKTRLNVYFLSLTFQFLLGKVIQFCLKSKWLVCYRLWDQEVVTVILGKAPDLHGD